jgi:hypothetical protein
MSYYICLDIYLSPAVKLILGENLGELFINLYVRFCICNIGKIPICVNRLEGFIKKQQQQQQQKTKNKPKTEVLQQLLPLVFSLLN